MSNLQNRARARKCNAKLSIRERNEMRALRAEGTTISELAIRFDVSDMTVLRHTADIPPPAGGWKKSGRPRKFDCERAAKLRKAGFSYQAIADRFGVTKPSVFRALRRLEKH